MSENTLNKDNSNRIQLSDHFSFLRLLRFTFPSIAMMVFLSVYVLVDGFFVSNFVGKTQFAAVNLVEPVFPIMGAVGLMIGTGGNAIVGIVLGQQKRELANAYFSMFIFAILIAGVVLGFLGYVFCEELVYMLGGRGELLSYATFYARYLFLAGPFFLLCFSLQNFFVTAEKPTLGFMVIFLGGILNILLDPVLIIGFDLGLMGAALATLLSQVVSAMIGIVYFFSPNDSLLSLTFKIRFDYKVFIKACCNGVSEMVDNAAYAVVTMVYNLQLLKMYGENGVAAFGVIMYLSFVFSAIFYGYSIGSAPVLSYQYGARNSDELSNVLQRSLKLIFIFSCIMVAISEFLAESLSEVFVGYDQELCALTSEGMRIFGLSFLFAGFAVFGSAFFTALNNGLVSALISFFRTFIFEIGAILILPLILGEKGIWLAIIVAELSSFLLTTIFLKKNSNKYQYHIHI